MFLGTRQDMDDVANAFLKVQEHAGELRAHESTASQAAG
jgi:hypothetical protein